MRDEGRAYSKLTSAAKPVSAPNGYEVYVLIAFFGDVGMKNLILVTPKLSRVSLLGNEEELILPSLKISGFIFFCC